MQMPEFGKLLVFFGLLLTGLGLVVWWGNRLGFGRLPGDIRIERGNFTFYFPLVTSILVSLLLTLLAWALRR